MTKLSDSETTLQDLREKVAKFQRDRNWERHHTLKNIAISLCLEAAELLEHFQWDGVYDKQDKQAIADELSDVIFNCLNFANVAGIDISSTFVDKLKRTEAKYPVEIFNKDSDSPDDYYQIKKAHRRGK